MASRGRRWRTPTAVRRWLANELRDGHVTWERLERAHIVSQPWAWPHTKVHMVMLGAALRQRDRREALGQLIRIVVAAPGSLTGRYPVGNTGRASMGLRATAPLSGQMEDLLASLASRPSDSM